MKKTFIVIALALMMALLVSFAVLSSGASESDVSVWDGTSVSTELKTDESGAYLIQSAADLAYYAKEVNSGSGKFNGKTLKLTTNIVWNEGDSEEWTATTRGLNAWTPIGKWGNTSMFQGTFDGQGHTISGLYAATTEANFGMFGVVWGSSTIKNLIIGNSKFFFYNSNSGGLIGIHRHGDLTVENVYADIDVNATGSYVGGLIGFLHGNGNTGITHNVTFRNVVYSGDLNSTNTYAGGFIGSCTPHVNNVALKWNLVYENCLADGSVTGKAAVGAFFGSHPAGTSANSLKFTVTDSMILAPVAIAATGWDNHGAFAGNLGIVDPASSGTNLWFVDSRNTNTPFKGLTSHDGTNLTSKFTFAEKTVDEINAMSTSDLVAAGFEGWADSSYGIFPKALIDMFDAAFADEILLSVWDGTSVSTALKTDESGAYLIQSAADLAYFAQSVNNGTNYSGKTVKLTIDIAWNEDFNAFESWTKTTTGLNKWTSIGPWGKHFRGTFDGQGHGVYGLYCVGTGNDGFFGSLGAGAVVKNLVIYNSFFSSVTNVGGIVGVVRDGTTTIDNCVVYAEIEGSANAGGIAGALWNDDRGNLTISNCATQVAVSVTGNYAGGIIGMQGTNACKLTVADCLSYCDVVANSYAGGINGGFAWNTRGQSLTVTNCIVIGEVADTRTDADTDGGVFGNHADNPTVSNVLFANDNGQGPAGNKASMNGTTGYAAEALMALTNADLKAAGFTNWVDTEGFVLPKSVAEMLGAEIMEDEPSSDTNTGSSDVSTDSATDTDTDASSDASTDVVTDLTVDVVKPNVKPAANASVYDGTKSTKLRTSGKNIYIDSAADLAYFAETVTNGTTYNGRVVHLTVDIIWNTGDASDWIENAPKYSWSCGKWMKFFHGTFDGQGHVISGLYQKSTGDNIGFINGVGGTIACIKNLSIVNSTFICTRTQDASANMGGLVGIMGEGAKLTVDTVYVDANLYAPGAIQVGGIVGRVHNGLCALTINNTVFAGTVEGSRMVGGIIGNSDINNNTAGKSATINLNNVLMMGSVKGGALTGGIIGRNENGETNMTNVVVAGAVNGEGNLAFQGGGKGAGKVAETLTNCFYVEEGSKNTVAGATAVKASAFLGEAGLAAVKSADWAAVKDANPMPKTVAEMLKVAMAAPGGNTNPPTSDNTVALASACAIVALVAAAAVLSLKKRRAE